MKIRALALGLVTALALPTLSIADPTKTPSDTKPPHRWHDRRQAAGGTTDAKPAKLADGDVRSWRTSITSTRWRSISARPLRRAPTPA